VRATLIRPVTKPTKAYQGMLPKRVSIIDMVSAPLEPRRRAGCSVPARVTRVANSRTCHCFLAMPSDPIRRIVEPRGNCSASRGYHLKSQQRRSAMKVKDAMHKGVDWVSPDTPVTEIAKLMRAHDIGCIPIGEDDQLVGMVTDRDIVCKGLAGNGFDASRAKARDVMTEGIHCCREDDDLAKAVHHMETLKVRRLPVINKSKRMVGMISLGDISQFAPNDLLTGWVKSVAAHH
jgi:CBS domain-containing protein